MPLDAGSVYVGVGADYKTQSFDKAFAKAQTEAKKHKAEVPIGADDHEARTKMDRLRLAIAKLKAEKTHLKFDADVAAAAARIKFLEGVLKDLEKQQAAKRLSGDFKHLGLVTGDLGPKFRTMADGAKDADRDLGRLGNRVRNLGMELSGGGVGGGGGGLIGAIGAAAKGMGPMAGAALAAAPAIVGLGGALTSLAGSLGAATVGAGVLGGGGISALVVGLGSLLGVAKPALSDIQKVTKAQQALTQATQLYGGKSAPQVTTAQNRYNAAVATFGARSRQAHSAQQALTMAQNQYGGKTAPQVTAAQNKLNAAVAQAGGQQTLNVVTRLRDLGKEWKKYTAGARHDLIATLGDGLTTAQADIHTFATISNKDMHSFRLAMHGAFTALRTREFRGELVDLADTFRKMLGPAVHGITNFFIGFGHVAVATQTYLVDMAKGFEHLSQRFLDWSRNSQNVYKFVDGVVAQFRSWVHLIHEVGSLLVTVFKGGATAGKGLVDGLSQVLDRWNKWLNTKDGQKAMQNFFKMSGELLKALLPPLTAMISGFAQMAITLMPAFIQALKIVNTLMTPFISALTFLMKIGPLRDLLAGFIAVGLAIKGLKTVTGLLAIDVSGVIGKYRQLRKAIQEAMAASEAGSASFGQRMTSRVVGALDGLPTKAGNGIRKFSTWLRTNLATAGEKAGVALSTAQAGGEWLVGKAKAAFAKFRSWLIGASAATGVAAGEAEATGQVEGGIGGKFLGKFKKAFAAFKAWLIGSSAVAGAEAGAAEGEAMAAAAATAGGAGGAAAGAAGGAAEGAAGGAAARGLGLAGAARLGGIGIAAYGLYNATLGNKQDLFGARGFADTANKQSGLPTTGGGFKSMMRDLENWSLEQPKWETAARKFGNTAVQEFNRAGRAGNAIKLQQLADSSRNIADHLTGDMKKYAGAFRNYAEQASAAAAHASGNIVRAMKSGLESTVFHTEPGMFRQVRAAFAKLPEAGKRSGAVTAIDYAKALEDQGKLPRGATDKLIRDIEKKYPQLIPFLRRTGHDSMSALAVTFRDNRAVHEVEKQVQNMRKHWDDMPRIAKTTSANAYENWRKAMDFLRHKIATSTGAQRAEAQREYDALAKHAGSAARATADYWLRNMDRMVREIGKRSHQGGSALVDYMNSVVGAIRNAGTTIETTIRRLTSVFTNEIMQISKSAGAAQTHAEAAATAHTRSYAIAHGLPYRPGARHGGAVPWGLENYWTLESFAAAGPVGPPGAFSARDNRLAMVRDGEHIWTPEEVRGVGGHARVADMRAQAVKGQDPAADGMLTAAALLVDAARSLGAKNPAGSISQLSSHVSGSVHVRHGSGGFQAGGPVLPGSGIGLFQAGGAVGTQAVKGALDQGNFSATAKVATQAGKDLNKGWGDQVKATAKLTGDTTKKLHTDTKTNFTSLRKDTVSEALQMHDRVVAHAKDLHKRVSNESQKMHDDVRHDFQDLRKQTDSIGKDMTDKSYGHFKDMHKHGNNESDKMRGDVHGHMKSMDDDTGSKLSHMARTADDKFKAMVSTGQHQGDLLRGHMHLTMVSTDSNVYSGMSYIGRATNEALKSLGAKPVSFSVEVPKHNTGGIPDPQASHRDDHVIVGPKGPIAAVSGSEGIVNEPQMSYLDRMLARGKAAFGDPIGSLRELWATGMTHATGGLLGRATRGLRRLATGGYVFPFPKGENFQWNRIDQGIDIQGPPGGPVLAVGDGVAGTGHDAFSGFGANYPTLKITTGPRAGSEWYYGHAKSTRTGGVKAGTILGVTQQTANEWCAAPAGWLEFGQIPIPPMGGGGPASDFLHQIAGNRVAGGAAAISIGRPMFRGPDGSLKIAGQRSLDDARKAANDKLSKVAASMSIPGLFAGKGAHVVAASDYGGVQGSFGSLIAQNPLPYAELSDPPSSFNWSALGHTFGMPGELPPFTRLRIGYKGRSVVGQKKDRGQGGPGIGGHIRAIDLHDDLARALGFSGLDLVTVSKAARGGLLKRFSMGGALSAARHASGGSGVGLHPPHSRNPQIRRRRQGPIRGRGGAPRIGSTRGARLGGSNALALLGAAGSGVQNIPSIAGDYSDALALRDLINMGLGPGGVEGRALRVWAQKPLGTPLPRQFKTSAGEIIQTFFADTRTMFGTLAEGDPFVRALVSSGQIDVGAELPGFEDPQKAYHTLHHAFNMLQKITAPLQARLAADKTRVTGLRREETLRGRQETRMKHKASKRAMDFANKLAQQKAHVADRIASDQDAIAGIQSAGTGYDAAGERGKVTSHFDALLAQINPNDWDAPQRRRHLQERRRKAMASISSRDRSAREKQRARMQPYRDDARKERDAMRGIDAQAAQKRRDWAKENFDEAWTYQQWRWKMDDKIYNIQQRDKKINETLHGLPNDPQHPGLLNEETAILTAAGKVLQASQSLLTPQQQRSLDKLTEQQALDALIRDPVKAQTAERKDTAHLEDFWTRVLKDLQKRHAAPSLITEAAGNVLTYRSQSTQLANEVQQQLDSFDQLQRQVFSGFGSNFLPAALASTYGPGNVPLGGMKFFGAAGNAASAAAGLTPGGGSGREVPIPGPAGTTVTVQSGGAFIRQHYEAPADDPHSQAHVTRFAFESAF